MPCYLCKDVCVEEACPSNKRTTTPNSFRGLPSNKLYDQYGRKVQPVSLLHSGVYSLHGTMRNAASWDMDRLADFILVVICGKLGFMVLFICFLIQSSLISQVNADCMYEHPQGGYTMFA